LLRTTWLCSGLTGAQDHTPDDLLEYPGAASRDFGRARLFARRSRVLKARELPPKNFPLPIRSRNYPPRRRHTKRKLCLAEKSGHLLSAFVCPLLTMSDMTRP